MGRFRQSLPHRLLVHYSQSCLHNSPFRIFVGIRIALEMPKPNKIYPTLYIGDLKNAEDVDSLFDIGITHVLSVGAGTSHAYAKAD